MGRMRASGAAAWTMRAVAVCAILGLVWMVEVLAPVQPPGVEELLARHASSDVSGLGGVDLRRFRESELGQRLIVKSGSASAALDIPEGLRNTLPIKSLHAAAFAVWLSPEETPEGWMLLSGTFDANAAVDALARFHGANALERWVEGVRCVGHRDEEQIAAALAGDTLYLGPPARLAAVLSVRKNQSPSAWRGRWRRVVRTGIGPGAILWGVGALGEGLSLGSGASEEESELFQSIRQAGFSLRLGASAALRVWLVPDSPESAGRIFSWLQRTRVIFSMVARKLDESGRLSTILAGLELKEDGDAVTLEVSVSSPQVEAWVDAELESFPSPSEGEDGPPRAR